MVGDLGGVRETELVLSTKHGGVESVATIKHKSI